MELQGLDSRLGNLRPLFLQRFQVYCQRYHGYRIDRPTYRPNLNREGCRLHHPRKNYYGSSQWDFLEELKNWILMKNYQNKNHAV